MELYQFCGVVVLFFATVSGQDGISPEEIASRQSQLTMDTFQFFQAQLSLEVYYLETRMVELENRVRALEGGTVILPVGPETPDRPGQETDEPHPEPEPGRPEQPEAPVTERPRRTRKPKPGKPNKQPVTVQPIQPVTEQRYVEPTTLPPGPTYDKTCAEIYNNGYIYSNEYTIDSDGDNGPLAPFTVYCDMEDGEGVTMVGHSDEQDNIAVNGYENPGSFNLQPIYNSDVSMEQLGALADASKNCRQHVKYACRTSTLMVVEPDSGLTYAWWVDRAGQKHVNFGGAPTDSGKCGCAYGGDNGDENTCFKGTETCNCDHPKAKNQVDEGDFTDKSLLPVMSVNLGNTGKKKARGAITLGKLICKG